MRTELKQKGCGRVTERTSRAIRLISRAAVVRKSVEWRHKLRLRRKRPFVYINALFLVKASFSLTSHKTVHCNQQTEVLKTAALGQCSNVFVIEMKWRLQFSVQLGITVWRKTILNNDTNTDTATLRKKH